MIKAIFPAGVVAVTVNGLHQWDYGRKLQISAEGLPSMAEVHFSCTGMKEAVVRLVTAEEGYTTTIPDQCLEQMSPITAWVVFVDETSGRTALEITLPILPRTKPMATYTPNPVQEDRYNELFAATMKAIEGLMNLDASVTAASKSAENAGASALTAGNSVSDASAFAQHAQASADAAANSAQVAKKAADTLAGGASGVMKDDEQAYSGRMSADGTGIYIFSRNGNGQLYHCFVKHTGTVGLINVGVVYWEDTQASISAPFYMGSENLYRLYFELVDTAGCYSGSDGNKYSLGMVRLQKQNAGGGWDFAEDTTTVITVKPLSYSYRP